MSRKGKDNPIEERFWSKMNKTDSCWLWTGPKFYNGYGEIRKPKGNVTGAHRISWELHFGPIPKGLFVCHKCDVKLCVNPDHLFLGTHRENMRDLVNKGLSGKGIVHPEAIHFGEENGNSKLKASQVIEIRAEFKLGTNAHKLAEIFHVTPNMISKIVTRRYWKNVP